MIYPFEDDDIDERTKQAMIEYEVTQERIGQPATAEGFLFLHMREAERE